jgi:fructose transport system substrate-binding protein
MLSGAAVVAQDKPIVGLITKTEGNPFFVKMREGAEEKAAELGVELRALAGAFDGDNEGQIAAIESLIAAGAKGFAIVPSDSSAIVPTIQSARDAGLMVIVLDTPLDPIDAADATFATDNRKAGELIGAWAKGTLGDAAADAKIAFLDLATNQPTVDYLRDQGFMEGFGIDVKDPNRYGDEDDARICGHEMTAGSEEGGVTAMETLLQRCPLPRAPSLARGTFNQRDSRGSESRPGRLCGALGSASSRDVFRFPAASRVHCGLRFETGSDIE